MGAGYHGGFGDTGGSKQFAIDEKLYYVKKRKKNDS